MKFRLRVTLFVVSALLFAGVLLAAMAGLPAFGSYQGPYGDLVTDTIMPLRHSQQAVAAVTLDYRGFDTLGEEFILFAAVAGALLLLRPQESETVVEEPDHAQDRPDVKPARGVAACGLLIFPFALLLGAYIVLHGHLTPGGGFQGGVLLASAAGKPPPASPTGAVIATQYWRGSPNCYRCCH
jgi:multicomponent Na+:H+ antiporter subunit B